jgi:uncharacterized tellurite resistance protein B-like protein
MPASSHRLCHYSPMSIFDLFRWKTEGNARTGQETETVRKIVQALDQLDPERAKFLAGFAYLLARVARSDLRISLAETRSMEQILTDRSGLPEEQAILVIQMAKTQSILFGSTENFLVSREFKSASTREERMAVLDCLFAVAATEDLISTVEDNEISQIADELRIEHRDFISIRLQYRDHLAVLQKPPAP